MEEQLITFETAVLAKEKGFNTGLHACYNKEKELISIRQIARRIEECICQSPTQSLLKRWLREVNNINVISYPAQPYSFSKNENTIWLYTIEYIDTLGEHGATDKSENLTYEDALEKGLREALKLIKL